MESRNKVTLSCKELRRMGREALSGHWKSAALGAAIFYIALQLPLLILQLIFADKIGVRESATTLYTLLMTGAFSYGFTLFALTLYRTGKSEVDLVFAGFEKFFRTVALMFWETLFVCLWMGIFMIPAFIYIGSVNPGLLLGQYDGGNPGSLGIFGVLLLIGVIVGIIVSIKYSQCYYLAIDHPELTALGCIRASKAITFGNKAKYFKMNLSFFGWLILGLLPMAIVTGVAQNYQFSPIQLFAMGILEFVLDIGFYYVAAYIMMTGTAFYEVLTGNVKAATAETAEDAAQETLSSMTADGAETENRFGEGIEDEQGENRD